MSPAGEHVPAAPETGMLLVGRINGVYGLRGWVKVYSYTERREDIVEYTPWTIVRQDLTRRVEVVEGRRHGKNVLARVAGCEDCDAARRLMGCEIYVERSQLPATDEGEYYWSDLIGCEVVNEQDERLGCVGSLLATGANDVLVVAGDRERLIPFVQGRVIRQVDLGERRILVDWALDY